MPWGDGHQPRLGKSGWQRQRDNARILKRDSYRCQLAIPGTCIGTATEVDHRKNLAAGGPDTDLNKRAACAPCHKLATQRQAQAGAAIHSRRRPVEPHPGLMSKRGGG